MMSIARIYMLNSDLSPVQLKDAIVERILQLQALTNVCQNEDFTDYSQELLSDYFWLQNSLLAQVSELFNAYNQRLEG
ncbi:MAG: hypothetical protein K0S11_101 [Gammaproteobacteria bacterium]|jgi:hypothetical protein|nr:hypothetical protein [Gammaproteobacteria bacterium]